MTGPTTAGITAVVPCLNEADNIMAAYQEMVAELGGYDLELLFVDDGSTDRTLEIVRQLAAADPRVHYLSFSRNFGFEAAFSAGYRYAARPWVLHLDADLQFPAAEAHKLVAAAEAGRDAVFGVRQTRHDPWVRRAGAAVYHAIARRLLNIEIPPAATTFRLVRTGLARRIVDLRLGTPYFLATLPRLTDSYTTVAVSHRARRHGRSKLHLRWLVGHAMGMFVGFSTRLATAAAVTALAAAALAALATVAAASGILGPAGAVAVGLALLAVLLTVSAVMTRYLVSVRADQTRPRLYYVREANIAIDPDDLLLPDQDRCPDHARDPAQPRPCGQPRNRTQAGR